MTDEPIKVDIKIWSVPAKLAWDMGKSLIDRAEQETSRYLNEHRGSTVEQAQEMARVLMTEDYRLPMYAQRAGVEKPQPETSSTIALWAEETFGQATALSTTIRAQKELTELLEKLQCLVEGTDQNTDREVMHEVADVCIVLARIQLFFPNGGSMEEAIQAKMLINRARRWKLDSRGHGQHL